MASYKNISYFPGLDSLRFFAAFLVVLDHGRMIREKNGFTMLEGIGLFSNGGHAVLFFFVLSGFLITYLLLREQAQCATISIGTFYRKRILRIWPLYFLLVIIGTVAIPLWEAAHHPGFAPTFGIGQVWYYYVFFLPCLVAFYYGPHLLAPLWSIGVEEAFYVFWAPALRWAGKQRAAMLCIGVIGIKLLLIMIAHFMPSHPLFRYLVGVYYFEAMAIGGLGAWLLFNRKMPLSQSILYNKWVQGAVYTLLAVFLLFHSNIHFAPWRWIFQAPVVSKLLLCCLFLYVILGVSVAENSLLRCNNKITSYLGRISYGIYMYHMVVVFVLVHYGKNYLMHQSPAMSAGLFYTFLLSGVIVVAAISHATFERFFLRLRKRSDKYKPEPKD